MTEQRTAGQQITEEVTSWPGVGAGHGRRGEFAFKLGGREIGHLHGDHAAHFMFPKEVWLELREQRRIVDHPVFPGKVGPAARRIENEADVRDVIELLRRASMRSRSKSPPRRFLGRPSTSERRMSPVSPTRSPAAEFRERSGRA
jgi:hypothetical protein